MKKLTVTQTQTVKGVQAVPPARIESEAGIYRALLFSDKAFIRYETVRTHSKRNLR